MRGPDTDSEGTTVINGGTIVPGDGNGAIRDGSLVLSGGRITGLNERPVAEDCEPFHDATFVDADGDVVTPGLINCHTHGLLDTPYSASAASLPGEPAAHRSKHLLEGCTTIVNADGFALPSEWSEANRGHPVKVEFGACPTPANFEAANAVDGKALTPEYDGYTVPQAVEGGAVMLGEVGAGSTLAGGFQRFHYVPHAIKERTGVEITSRTADRIITSVIGRHADRGSFDERLAREVLMDAGLDDHLEPADLRDLVMEVTWPPIEKALDGFDEVADFSAAYGVPMLVHNSAPSKERTRQLARRGVPLIAGHSNHPTFPEDEALEFARTLQSHGNATVEIDVFDIFNDESSLGRPKTEMQELFFEFIDCGLADVVATDFVGGDWHGMLIAIEAVVDRGIATVEEVIPLVTGNVAAALPAIGATRGTLQPGKAADVLIVDGESLSTVKRVFVDGKPVVESGSIVDRNRSR